MYLDQAGSEPMLYDPYGGYPGPDGKIVRGSGDMFYGKDANLAKYVKWQEATGSKVTLTTMKVTSEQGAKIAAAMEQAGAGPLFMCTPKSAEVLQSAFPEIRSTLFPRGLRAQFMAIIPK